MQKELEYKMESMMREGFNLILSSLKEILIPKDTSPKFEIWGHI